MPQVTFPPPVLAPPAPAPREPKWVIADDAIAVQRFGFVLVRLVTGLMFFTGLAALFFNQLGIDRSATSPPSEGFLRLTTWAYSISEGTYFWTVSVALPPIGAALALVLLAVGNLRPTTNGLYVTARRRNGLSTRVRRGTRETWGDETGRMTGKLSVLRGTKSIVLSSTRGKAWALRIIGSVGALLMVWVGWYSLTTAIEEKGMTAGVGPTVALYGGLTAFVGTLMAMPWRRVRRFAFGPHGEVEVVGETPTGQLSGRVTEVR